MLTLCWAEELAKTDIVLHRGAPCELGRRWPHSALAKDVAQDLLCLDHAGASATWRSEQPRSAVDEQCVCSQRRARALKDSEWDTVLASYAAAARPKCAILVGDDNLLSSALRDQPGRVIEVVRAVASSCQHLTLLLTVDPCVPGSYDLTDALDFAGAVEDLVDAFIAGSGSARMPALYYRPGAALSHFLPAAKLLASRVKTPVYPRGFADDAGAFFAAAAGFSGALWDGPARRGMRGPAL